MDKKDLKKMDLTPIEDLITEDFGPIGTPERDQFEMECDAHSITVGCIKKDDPKSHP